MARIEQSIEINVPVEKAYDQLAQFEQYPRFVQNVAQVQQLDDRHLHLRTRAGNLDMEWDAEITQQVPGKCIAWRNTNGPRYEGRIELQPIREDGTRVTVTMECDPKQQILAQHGNAEAAIAEHAERDLARFKKFIERLGREVGEIHPLMSDAGERTAAASGAGSAEKVPGESIGKAIGQTESERRDVAGAAEKKRGGQQETRPAGGEGGSGAQGRLQPEMQWMHGIFQLWDEPFSMMRRLSADMEQFLDRFARPGMAPAAWRAGSRPGRNGAWAPQIEIAQRQNEFVICAELAGVRREDVQVEVRNDRLTIEGERRQEPPHEPREMRSTERSYGRFYREIALPPGADANAASAAMHDGMLEITVPVIAGNQKGRRIAIRQ